MNINPHTYYMQMALRRAQAAAEAGEVPTGCVIVNTADDRPHVSRILGSAHNQTELLRDPTAHAEILAITQAAAALGDWRLTGTAIYITKEPCPMCSGAIILARIPLVVYGVSDPARGGNSVFKILDHPALNHRCRIISGILENDCRNVLQNFFRARRESRLSSQKKHRISF